MRRIDFPPVLNENLMRRIDFPPVLNEKSMWRINFLFKTDVFC
jgi:hypothetical protein